MVKLGAALAADLRVVSRERRNISAMIRGTRGGRDGARVVGQRETSESGGPARD